MRDNLRNLHVVHLGNVTLNGTDELKSGWVDLRGFNSCTIMVVANVIADAGTALPVCAKLFCLCVGSIATAWARARPVAGCLPDWPLPSVGRPWLRPGAACS